MSSANCPEVIQPRRTQPGGDPAHHCDAEINLPDRRLQPIDDIARCLEFTEPSDGGDEIQLDAGEQLAQLVVQLPRDPGALFFTHLLETLGQGRVQINVRWKGQLHASDLLTRRTLFPPLCR